MIFTKMFKQMSANKQSERRAELYRNLLRHEARVGGTLFGPVSSGSRREFFCLDEHTWVWHEEYTDKDGKRHSKTTRYDVRPNGILKAQDGQPYQPLSADETMRLVQAVDAYDERIRHEVYSFV